MIRYHSSVFLFSCWFPPYQLSSTTPLNKKTKKSQKKKKKKVEDRLQVLECPKLWRWMVGTQKRLAPPFDSSIISIDFFVESC